MINIAFTFQLLQWLWMKFIFHLFSLFLSSELQLDSENFHLMMIFHFATFFLSLLIHRHHHTFIRKLKSFINNCLWNNEEEWRHTVIILSTIYITKMIIFRRHNLIKHLSFSHKYKWKWGEFNGREDVELGWTGTAVCVIIKLTQAWYH